MRARCSKPRRQGPLKNSEKEISRNPPTYVGLKEPENQGEIREDLSEKNGEANVLHNGI